MTQCDCTGGLLSSRQVDGRAVDAAHHHLPMRRSPRGPLLARSPASCGTAASNLAVASQTVTSESYGCRPAEIPRGGSSFSYQRIGPGGSIPRCPGSRLGVRERGLPAGYHAAFDILHGRRLGERLIEGIERAAAEHVRQMPSRTSGRPASERVGRQLEMIVAAGATPVIFPSFGLTADSDTDFIARHAAIARHLPGSIGFELSTVFVPSGRVLALDAYADLVQMPECLGAKHSSLSRRLEWQRLALRDRLRPDFHVFTGNDLAIDMVRYGSDWLLGLSTAWPEAFAQRDAWWAPGDARFDELDDAFQALGDFAFRPPVPAYKHSMAQALHLRGLLASDQPHPDSPRRPASDRESILTILGRIATSLAAD